MSKKLKTGTPSSVRPPHRPLLLRVIHTVSSGQYRRVWWHLHSRTLVGSLQLREAYCIMGKTKVTFRYACGLPIYPGERSRVQDLRVTCSRLCRLPEKWDAPSLNRHWTSLERPLGNESVGSSEEGQQLSTVLGGRLLILHPFILLEFWTVTTLTTQ